MCRALANSAALRVTSAHAHGRSVHSRASAQATARLLQNRGFRMQCPSPTQW